MRPNQEFSYSILIKATIIVISISGCRRTAQHPVKPSDPEIPLQIVQESDLETYPLNDSQCQSSGENLDHIQTTTLNRWQNGHIEQILDNILNLEIHRAPLKSPAVESVLTGAIFRRFCDSSQALPPNCSYHDQNEPGWKSVSDGAPLKICQPDTSPPRNSQEHLALSGMTAIGRAAQALSHLISPALNIPAITVLVTPRFESHWMPWSQHGENASYQALIADNLAYFPPTSTTPPYIAIFPKRKSSHESVNLWESEFVLAHEYSHHVEHSMGVDHFNEHRGLMRIAVSEGFADALSFASLGASDNSLKGIPCIGMDRAPDQLEFSGGIAKLINDALLERASTRILDRSRLPDSEIPCQGTLPHSPHGIGAILAHWVWEMSSLTPAFEIDRSKTLTSVSIGWIKNVEASIGPGTPYPKKDLTLIARALESAILAQFTQEHPISDNMRELLRQKMNFAFPAVASAEWFKARAL